MTHATLILLFLGAVVVFLACVRFVRASERLVILGSGQAHKVAGPGVVFTLPLQKARRVDISVKKITLSAGALKGLLDGELTYEIIDAAKTLNVDNVDKAVLQRAENLISKELAFLTLEEVFCRRDSISARWLRALNGKTLAIGVKIVTLDLSDFSAHKKALRDIEYLLTARLNNIYALVDLLSP